MYQESNLLAQIFNESGCSMPRGINTLSKQDSKIKWEELFQSKKEERFFPKEHWLFTLTWNTKHPGLLEAYNKKLKTLGISILNNTLKISDIPMYFFSNQIECYELSWSVFCENWLEFYELNDQAFSWLPSKNIILLWSPLGWISSEIIPISAQQLISKP